MKKRTVDRPRILLREEDFIGLSDDDHVIVPVRPTGDDANYPKPFDIEIPVRWWRSKSYVTTRSWRIDGIYSFTKPTSEMVAFIRSV